MTTLLVLDDGQQLLSEAARDLVATHAPLDAVRLRRDTSDSLGLDLELWRRLADLGWTAITLPEHDGGAGGRLADLAVVLEALGRTLTPTPYLATVLLGGGLVAALGTDEQRRRMLPEIASGELLLAAGLQDGDHHGLQTSTVATRTDHGWSLAGTKRLVIDGHLAHRLVLLAAIAGTDDLGLFLVDHDAKGVRVEPRSTVDHRIVADVFLDGCAVAADGVLAAPAALDVVERVVDAATAGLCAEMLGGVDQIFEITLQYLEDRIQFDVPIGSFQALQHRAAVLHCDLELARSLVRAAIEAVDADASDRAALVSAAKATMSELFRRASAEALQLHGGIGMTDEASPGLYVKRARVASTLLGDATHHRRRFAEASGWIGQAAGRIR